MNMDLVKKNSCTLLYRLLPVFLLIFYAMIRAFLSGADLPANETRHSFQIFQYFYTVFYYYGELARWMPYDAFGLPTYSDQIALGPFEIFCMIMGKMLGVTDTLLLYRIASVLDVIPLILGFWLLCGLWFKHPLTWFIVCLSVIMTTFTHTQVFFMYRYYAMIPLTLYCLLRFYRDEKPWLFWSAAVLTVLGFFGNTTDAWPTSLILLAFIQIPLIIKTPSALKSLIRPDKASVLLMSGFIAITALYAILLTSAVDGTLVPSAENDAKLSADNAMLNILSIFQYKNPLNVFRMLFSGCMPQMIELEYYAEPIIYAGILPLIMAFLAIGKVRNPAFLSLLVGAGVTLLIALGVIGAIACYYFPEINFLHRMGFVWQFERIFIILMAGWGCEYAFERMTSSRFLWAAALLVVAIDLTVTPILGMTLSQSVWSTLLMPFGSFNGRHWNIPLYLARTELYILIFIAGAVLLSKRFSEWRPTKNRHLWIGWQCALMAGLLFDLTTYRRVYFRYDHALTPEAAHHIESSPSMQTKPLAYVDTRQNPKGTNDLTQTQRDALDTCTATWGADYPIMFGVSQIDNWGAPYSDNFRRLRVTRSASSLLDTLNSDFDMIDNPANDKFRFLTGNTAPKLRFVRHAIVCPTEQKAAEELKIRSIDELKNTVVLLKPSSGSDSTQHNLDPNRPAEAPLESDKDAIFEAEVSHFSANRAEFAVKVTGKHGGWLVYADSFTPEWTATVDGASVPVERANLAFKAVWLAPGKHDVCFAYDGGFWGWAAWIEFCICFLSAIFFVVWMLWCAIRLFFPARTLCTEYSR